MNKFEEIRALEKNWDSYNGDPVSEEVINVAQWLQKFFENIGVPSPQPMPGSDGSISFEWDHSEITVTPELGLEIGTWGTTDDLVVYEWDWEIKGSFRG